MKKVLLLGIPLLVLIVVFALVVGRKAGPEHANQVPEASMTQSDAPAMNAAKTAIDSSVSETPEPPLKPVLSDLVSTILSGDASYRDRAKAIDALGRNLSTEDVAALRDFLLTAADEHKMSPMALNSLKNDVLETLLDQEVMPEGLEKQVVDMFNDPDADYMWKEYCLQFMEPLLKKTSGSSGQVAEDGSQEQVDVVQETLFSALDERDEDLAGTALLGLTRLARDGRDVDSGEVTAKALEIAGDHNASDRCRLTAMRVAASAGNEEILPVARNLAQNARTDLLKAAAITTLGDFADLQDKDLLTQLASNRNRQISSAARMALAKYSE